MADADLANFPVCIEMTDANNRLFRHARSAGEDILFTASDGATRLSHEIEEFTSTGTKALLCWVRTPVLSSSSDTTVYIYYGNSAGDSQGDSTGVWDQNYVGVWHMSGVDAPDSTSNHRNAAVAGGDPRYTPSGKMAGAIAFDGDGDSISVSDEDALSFGDGTKDSPFSISAWVYLKANDFCILEKGYGGMKNEYALSYSGSGRLTFEIWDKSASAARLVRMFGAPLVIGQWHHVVGTYNGSGIAVKGMNLYIDGADCGLTEFHFNDYIAMEKLKAGLRIGATGHGEHARYANGAIDEVRISNAVRTADWIMASYNNQSGAAKYLEFGKEDTCKQ